MSKGSNYEPITLILDFEIIKRKLKFELVLEGLNQFNLMNLI